MFGFMQGKKGDWGENSPIMFFLLQKPAIPSSISSLSDIFGAVSNPEFGTYEMKIGAITFQIASGDITKEKTDVLVNSTARTFNVKSGTLSKKYT